MTSPTEQALRWVGGAYFSHYRQHSTESTNSDAFADAIGQTTGPNLYSFDQSVIDQQTAVFVDLTYKIMPRFEITVGERYYELRDSLENVQSGVLAAWSPVDYERTSFSFFGRSRRRRCHGNPAGSSADGGTKGLVSGGEIREGLDASADGLGRPRLVRLLYQHQRERDAVRAPRPNLTGNGSTT